MDSINQGIKRVDEPLPELSTYDEALSREGDDSLSRFRALANMVTVLDLLVREVEKRCELRHQEQMAAHQEEAAVLREQTAILQEHLKAHEAGR